MSSGRRSAWRAGDHQGDAFGDDGAAGKRGVSDQDWRISSN
jgi:hypothetical protein